jgi:hypothetical protein
MARNSRDQVEDLLSHQDQRTGPPPVNPPSRPPGPPAPPNQPPSDPDDDPDERFDDIQLFGRDESYDAEGWEEFQAKMRQVASSNVYAYGFQQETAASGILYVTFLNWTPKDFRGDGSREGAGPTYAYYDFPTAKYKAFEAEAASSAGSAVWDFCRVRHSAFEHQHTYRLIQTAGEYVPRKATAGGFKRRNTNQGKGQLKLNQGGFARQQLPSQKIAFRKVLPPRNYAASPNRGAPNRGSPNRGN